MPSNDYNTFVDKTKAYPIIKESLDKNNKNILVYIRQYVDRNHDILYNNGTYALIWRYEGPESDILYKNCNFDANQMNQIIKDSKQVKSTWKHLNKPWLWLLVNIIKYFKDSKKEKEMQLVILYLSFSMYASIHYKYFKGYPINENIMNYTISNLNNRYDLKKLGSLINVLNKISIGCHQKYQDYLLDKNFCDRYIVEYIMNLFTRINNFVKEIKNQYQINKENGRYQNYETSNNDEEDYHETTNLSNDITKLSNKCINVITINGLNRTVCNTAAKMCNVSTTSVLECQEMILDKYIEELREFIVLFLQQYLIVDKHPIESFSSSSFFTYANKIYTKSNTNSKEVIRMKDLLDKWLNESCEKYKTTQRVATLISYRKAIFLTEAMSVRACIIGNY